MIGKIKYILCFLLVVSSASFMKLDAQEDFYEFGQVREVKIYFELDCWKEKMDSLFSSGDNYTRIKANVVIDGITYKQCGIRYKGFSSWNSDETKNPFNIRLDYTYKNQNHQGYKKLKLSNVIYDPSFVREALSYHIIGQYMPSSKANYANVYINDTLIGLYSNVEAVDECFVEKHYGSDDNPFFKGNPESLSYPFGQNANLAYTHGSDSSGYMEYYKLESEYGWTELFNFIDILNNDTASISEILNVDRTLWMHAFNYSVLNLDSYIAYAQNYYLYQDDNMRFNPIIWDLNMSFGSFRHSDGSLNFSGLSIEETKELDPLQHLTFSISPRPLMKNLFLNSTYRKMYLAHIRTIMEEYLQNGEYLELAEGLHENIETHVLADTNKFYSDEDFQNNIYTEVGESTELYPGLQDLVEARVEYLNSYSGINGYPEFSNIQLSDEIAERNVELTISVDVDFADKVFLMYRCDEDAVFSSANMSNNAGNYSVSIIPDGNVFQYYFWAENDSAGAFLPKRAAFEFYDLPVKTEVGDIVINEIKYNPLAISGVNNMMDIEWIEFYNPNSDVVHLESLLLNYNSSFIFIDDTVIQPYEHYVVYSFDYYFNWSLLDNLAEEYLTLANCNAEVIDSVLISSCISDRTIGRYPDGNEKIKVLEPSLGQANNLAESENNPVSIYPNPVTDYANININANFVIDRLVIRNSLGQMVYIDNYVNNNLFSVLIDTKEWERGVYFIQFYGEEEQLSTKFVK